MLKLSKLPEKTKNDIYFVLQYGELSKHKVVSGYNISAIYEPG